MSWAKRAQRDADELRAAGLKRRVRDFDARGPQGTIDGRAVVSFGSNDYLGLTAHPAVIAAARAALDRWGAGSGAARLIVGSRPIHSELEAELAAWKNAPKALAFSTGFAANVGALTTFGGRDVTIFSDELNHASIVDGCRLSRSQVVVFPHRDYDALEKALENAGRAIVVTDHVFSMDGDVADVDRLSRLCVRHDALLVLDEAHSVLEPDPDLGDAEVLRVGTLSETTGAVGGFVAGPASMIELMIDRARTFIYTTASSPADAAAALAGVRIVRSPEGAGLKDRLRSLVERLVPGHRSPIVPVVIGDEEAAMRASSALLEAGFLVPAIRPPSVPPGSSRLRVTVSAAHTEEQVDSLKASLAELVPAGAHA